MRVIAGQFRSRQLVAPRGMDTRPTSDRLRETLFNVLGPRLQGARFADLYAGSGAVGIEALSRGAAHCLFAERTPAALAAIRQNLTQLGIASGTTIDSRPVSRVLADAARKGQHLDVVFLDPPYDAADEYRSTLTYLGAHSAELLADGAVVVAEHAKRDTAPESLPGLTRMRLLQQGDAALSFYSVSPAS